MKYLYKQTGVVVESSIKLDSTIFTPYEEEKKAAAEPAVKAPAKPAEKKTATTRKTTNTRKTTTAKRTTSAKK